MKDALSSTGVLDLQRAAGNVAVCAVISEPRSDAGAVVQRAKADVAYSVAGRNIITIKGAAVGKGGRGGVSHSEQAVWKDASDVILNHLRHGRPVEVTFVVDTLICDRCQPWFETTVHQQLATAANAGGTQATLLVTVMGHVVTVNGANTIWPPEVAEVPTYHRLAPIERSMRLLREGRDEQARVHKLDNVHARLQIDTLQALLEGDFQHHGLALAAIEARMQAAAGKVARMQRGRFDEDAAGKTLLGYMNGLTFSEMLRSGALGIPDEPAELSAPAVVDWLDALENRLYSWYERAVEDEFEGFEN